MPANPPLVVKRWTRFGHDRLYVTGADGEEIGWTDLKTGVTHAASPDVSPALSHAVACWKLGREGEPSRTPSPTAALSAAVPSTAGPISSNPLAEVKARPATAPAAGLDADLCPPPIPVTAWADLAANAPGAAARAQATSLRDAAPVRTFFARLVNLRTPERAWRIGADGEELVAAELARLVQYDPRWRMLHAIPVGVKDADIDHLVMGPGGVFTLNAKHHPRSAVWVGGDTFLVNGRRRPYVRNSRHEAGRAARLLTAASGIPVSVTGVIVPVRVRSVTIKTAPRDVAVVPRRQIASWLLGRGQVLDHPALTVISEVARRSSSWQPSRR